MPVTPSRRLVVLQVVVLRRIVIALFALFPLSCLAQVGRDFVSLEAYVGLARMVYVGRIEKLGQIEYKEPLKFPQTLGKPYRCLFKVSETIRGEKAESVELVLALQTTIYLQYLRDHHVEIMLVGGPNRLDDFPAAEVGIEEQGKRVDGDWYQFRILEPLPLSETSERQVEDQIDTYYDFGRMFTADLTVIHGRDEILKRARAFAKKHSEMLEQIWLRVPNEFGALVGDPNAYCGITLPVCPETERSLVALLKDPGIILRRQKGDHLRWDRTNMLIAVLQVFAPFPSKENAALLRTFAKGYDPAKDGPPPQRESPQMIKRLASELLMKWKL